MVYYKLAFCKKLLIITNCFLPIATLRFAV
jgi:hypothetical protein